MATFDYLDPNTQQYVTLDLTGPPIGAIVAYNGTTAPAGWHLCDGSAHGSTALQAVLGSANTPNLRDRFILAWGSRAVGGTGGAATVTLAAAQSGIPAHAHTGSVGGVDTDHAHSYTSDTEAAHRHSRGYASNYIRYTNLSNDTSPDDILVQNPYDNASETSAGGHTHGGNTDWVGGAGSAGDPHLHVVSITNNTAVGASSAHENRPPYYALTFIIRKS